MKQKNQIKSLFDMFDRKLAYGRIPKKLQNLQQNEKKIFPASPAEKDRELFLRFKATRNARFWQMVVAWIESRHFQLAFALLLVLFSGLFFYQVFQLSTTKKNWNIVYAEGISVWHEGQEKIPVTGDHLPDNSSMRISQNGKITALTADGARLVVTGPAVIKWTKTRANHVLATMELGTMFIETPHGNSINFEIQTPFALYSKKGTIAKIRTSATGDIVSVLQGEFTAKDQEKKQNPVIIKAQESWEKQPDRPGKIGLISVMEKNSLENFQKQAMTEPADTQIKEQPISEEELREKYHEIQNIFFKDGSRKRGYVFTQDGRWYIRETSGVTEFSFETVDKIQTIE